MPYLSYVNIFAENIVSLSSFYMNLFDFKEIVEIRSPIFRGVSTGKSAIGFNAYDAYELLGVLEEKDATGIKFLLNFDVDSECQVSMLTEKATGLGASLVKNPYKTYYNWYQSILKDPEGNLFRINTVL